MTMAIGKTTKAKNVARPTPDTYFGLVKRFPLRPIHTEEQLDQATEILDELLDRPQLDAGETDYLYVLGDLMSEYEEKAYPMEDDVSEADMLRHLMEAQDRTQADIARGTGIAESTISELLSEKRRMTVDHIQKLAAYFHVSPGVFLPEPPARRK
jgi:HTH-type transcriptional regulator/antitoxin HigA